MLIRAERKTKLVAVTETIYTHKCDVCGNEYTSQYEQSNGCSDACYDVLKGRRRKERTQRSTQRRRECREEARRAKPDSMCAYCQKAFRPARVDAKYCSSKCKQASYRKRKAQEREKE